MVVFCATNFPQSLTTSPNVLSLISPQVKTRMRKPFSSSNVMFADGARKPVLGEQSLVQG